MRRKTEADVIEHVVIERLGARADGIAQHEGLPFYVAGAIPGDVVSARVVERKKGGVFAEIAHIETPSPDRVTPGCRHYEQCGGCQIQHISPAAYENWISARVTETLSRQGVEGYDLRSPIIVPPRSRRRVSFKAINTINGIVFGFNEQQSHQIIDLEECPATSITITELLPPLKALLAIVASEKALLTVQITETASGLDILIDGAVKESLDARETLAQFADDHDIARLQCMREGQLDPISMRREPVMRFGGVPVLLPAGAFTQAAEVGEKALVSAVLEATEGYARVADLFCGVGTFTFPLARSHQVLAVEGAQDALVALENGRNSAQSSGIKLKQIISRHRDLFRRPLTATELKPFEVVVLDPPRAGAEAQAVEIAQSDVKQVVSVSCNINTFARDVRLLQDGGYKLKSVQPIDQFLWSHHLEIVGVLDRE